MVRYSLQPKSFPLSSNMQGNSRPVISNQSDVHPDLHNQVLKHANSDFLQPIKAFSSSIFNEVHTIVEASGRPVILDSGCGTGASTRILAERYPEHIVIGVDKSRHRLEHCLKNELVYHHNNLLLVHSDLIDFWRLAVAACWSLSHHFFLYPNPWPKKKHLTRRWYAHPVMPSILTLGGQLECRSNWNLYIEEFSTTLIIMGQAPLMPKGIAPSDYLTPFEKKYCESDHRLFQLICDLS